MTDRAIPWPEIGPDAGQAFPRLLAAGVRAAHAAGGGDEADADALSDVALRVGAAILEGEIRVELADEPQALREALARSPAVHVDPQDEARAPLVLEGTGLHLARYWQYQRSFYDRLAALNRRAEGLDLARLKALLDRHFPAGGPAAPDWQKAAAATAILRRLCVISGGPGTGKTSTVVRILAILLSLAPSLRVAIAAPTGKAAARVQDSIRQQLERLELSGVAAAAMPREPHTLHRLLHYQHGRTSFRHGADHPLPYDVVVVDEASMLDLALASKLVRALHADARLILLGDKDQLSSVEAGAVYAGVSSSRVMTAGWKQDLAAITGQSLAEVTEGGGTLADAVVWLEHSYRFAPESALARLARAINAEDPARVRELLAGGGTITHFPSLPPPAALAEKLMEGFSPYVEAVQARRPAGEVFAAFDRFRVLCSAREGAYGSLRLGELLAASLRRRLRAPAGQPWFPGRPVLVTANDYSMRLFNGDVGILLPAAGGGTAVHFQGSDGRLRLVPALRLGSVQDAMAMTVHRAQGSEFEAVALVIEPSVKRTLSRQLAYTAVTRARSGVQLWGDPSRREADPARPSARGQLALPI